MLLQDSLVAAYDEWLDQHVARSIDRQRAQVETAKLLVTFTSGVAAALLSAALQVGGQNWENVAASGVFAATTALTVLVILRDRLTEADRDQVANNALAHQWTNAEILDEFRSAALAAWTVNQTVVAAVRAMLGFQFLLAATASGLSIWSMVWG